MAKLNLYSAEWCDIVFENRPKEYGAYALRKNSSTRHRNAILITVLIFLAVFTLPGLIKSMIPDKKEQNIEVTAMSEINVEKNEPKDVQQPLIEPEAVKLKSTIRFTPPVIKDDAEVRDEDLMKDQNDLKNSNLDISTADVIGSTDADAVDMADLQGKQTQVTEEYQQPFLVVEQPPAFPGGQEALNNYLAKNISYPSIARESGIQGTVYVSFVVSKSGAISEVKVLRGIGGGCDEEAVRVVRGMPAWIPGRQSGSAVPVKFTLPVRFVLH